MNTLNESEMRNYILKRLDEIMGEDIILKIFLEDMEFDVTKPKQLVSDVHSFGFKQGVMFGKMELLKEITEYFDIRG